ncbi:MAG TPA: hypothetical protein VK444_00105 [Methanobacteriaceae archaeon]|nr:hypothetical protein [Methanobacteriaceae archaeon]
MPTPHQEILVLSSLKYFQVEYKKGVPLGILKMDLDLDDDELNQVLLKLESKGSISKLDDQVKLVNSSSSDDDLVEEIVVAKENNNSISDLQEKPSEDSSPVEDIELTETEQKSLELIKSLVDESKAVSRHVLEGHLLYGDLRLNNLRMYNLLNSLENKGFLSRIQRVDGSYYSLN